MCLMAKITALSTFSVSSAVGTPQPEARGLGGLSEWHVCTAQRLQKRFNAADMLFCLSLYMSFLLSSVDKQFECDPSKPLQLIRKAEEPEMKSRMTLTSKRQLVLHFLLFTLALVCLIMLKALCIFELCFMFLVFSYGISIDWKEI